MESDIRSWVVVLLLAVSPGCATSPTIADSSPASAGACAPAPLVYVAVHTTDRELLLCDGGRAVRTFGVRLARNGTGKTREGDKKVPLGRYSLGGAITSAKFGLFLAIGYPTPEQRSQGMTGSAVGVHGPARGARWLGRFVNTFDTTDGCVGLATDDDVREIAAFVRDRDATQIVID